MACAISSTRPRWVSGAILKSQTNSVEKPGAVYGLRTKGGSPRGELEYSISPVCMDTRGLKEKSFWLLTSGRSNPGSSSADFSIT